MIGVLRASRAFIGKRSVLVKLCRDKVLVKFCLLGTRFSENDFCIPKYFWKMLCSKFCIPKTLFGKRFLQKLWKFSARNSFQVKFFEVQCSEFLRILGRHCVRSTAQLGRPGGRARGSFPFGFPAAEGFVFEIGRDAALACLFVS